MAAVVTSADQNAYAQCRNRTGMRPFDRVILVCHAAMVAGRRHAVVRAQRLIAFGQIRRRVLLSVAERRREAVAAVFLRCATKRPQGGLQFVAAPVFVGCVERLHAGWPGGGHLHHDQ
jgi:hypothetical protein